MLVNMRYIMGTAFWLLVFVICSGRRLSEILPNDASVIDMPIILSNPEYKAGNDVNELSFVLLYSQLPHWREMVLDFAALHPTLLPHIKEIGKSVEEKLAILALTDESVYYEANRETYSAAVSQLLIAARVHFHSTQTKLQEASHTQRHALHRQHNFFLTSKRLSAAHSMSRYKSFLESLLQADSPSELAAALHPRYKRSQLPDFILNNASPIMIYQTLNAFTGGTSAMRVLAKALQNLGFPVVLCNHTNQHIPDCATPSDNSLVITGEWCDQVLASYNIGIKAAGKHPSSPSPMNSHQFGGRGLQYFLGFHPGRHWCRGFVPLAHSHYIHHTLTYKSMSAYYLGCPMTEHIEEELRNLLESILLRGDTGLQKVYKENLLVLDPDYFSFYTPEQKLGLYVPIGTKVVTAENIMPKVMPNLLQRAKVVMDLALPGHERISNEAILFGAIPVLSSRWNGGSFVDFPAKYKMYSHNSSEINSVISLIIQNYTEELKDFKHSQHWLNVAIMWNQLVDTADIVFSSSHLHFVLSASTLQDEYVVNFQILALLYLFPLCSIDVYVSDLGWYLRHHYILIDMLRQSGHVRYDPVHPDETLYFAFDPLETDTERLYGYSYVRFRRLSYLETLESSQQSCEIDKCENNQQRTLQDALLLPPWQQVITMTFPRLLTFRNSEDLLSHVSRLKTAEESLILKDSKSRVLVMGPQAPVNVFMAQVLHGNFEDQITHELEGLRSVSICDLIRLTSDANGMPYNGAHDVVCGVVDSVSWRAYYSFAVETSFACI